MRKALSIILSLIFVLSLVSCTKNETIESQDPVESVTQADTYEDITETLEESETSAEHSTLEATELTEEESTEATIEETTEAKTEAATEAAQTTQAQTTEATAQPELEIKNPDLAAMDKATLDATIAPHLEAVNILTGEWFLEMDLAKVDGQEYTAVEEFRFLDDPNISKDNLPEFKESPQLGRIFLYKKEECPYELKYWSLYHYIRKVTNYTSISELEKDYYNAMYQYVSPAVIEELSLIHNIDSYFFEYENELYKYKGPRGYRDKCLHKNTVELIGSENGKYTVRAVQGSNRDGFRFLNMVFEYVDNKLLVSDTYTEAVPETFTVDEMTGEISW